MLDNMAADDEARTQRTPWSPLVLEVIGLVATGRHIPNTMQPLLTLIKKCLAHTTCV